MKKNALLTKRELGKVEKQLLDWSLSTKKTSLKRTFYFDNHVTALVFIARITVHAEVLKHHPDVKFTYKKVIVTLTTHDLKGLSKIDIIYAKRINDCFSG